MGHSIAELAPHATLKAHDVSGTPFLVKTVYPELASLLSNQQRTDGGLGWSCNGRTQRNVLPRALKNDSFSSCRYRGTQKSCNSTGHLY